MTRNGGGGVGSFRKKKREEALTWREEPHDGDRPWCGHGSRASRGPRGPSLDRTTGPSHRALGDYQKSRGRDRAGTWLGSGTRYWLVVEVR